jgi:predicted MFS family arabinose efflux permease
MMTHRTAEMTLPMSLSQTDRSSGAAFRNLVIGIIAFLTLVDLFATQAILPSLVKHYGVSPASMGLAVNASTFGMAVSGILVSLLSRRINRRLGIVLSLAILSLPTALLAVAPDLATFATLRVVQGLFMSASFTLTLAYLAEHCSAKAAGGAFAAYITGNVASNLFGRLMSAAVADHFGLSANFHLFAALNLCGAVLAFLALSKAKPMVATDAARSAFSAFSEHLKNPALRAAFTIGFLILFAFIGTFTYVNFVLIREPFAISPMQIGLVYFVFVPSVLTTPFAGLVAVRFGTRPTFWSALALAGIGLPMLVTGQLPLVLVGLALVGVGTFFAQAAATGFVGRAATGDRGSAGGIYLACYFFGGLVGSAILGQAFDRLGWPACVAGIAIALALAAFLAFRLTLPMDMEKAR